MPQAPLVLQLAVAWLRVQGTQDSPPQPVCGLVLLTHLSLQSFWLEGHCRSCR